MKRKHIWVNLIGLVFLLGQLLAPAVAVAADSSHYELQLWQFSKVGDSFGIGFGYIGNDGVPLSVGLPLDKDLVAGHENDPSWTGLDSVAPILAYIKKYGIDNNIMEDMNPTVFDPTIFKALTGQGLNLNQLGGPNVPPGTTPSANLVGRSTLPSTLDKNVVGIGIPAPDLSAISSTKQSTQTSTPATSSQAAVQKSEAVTNPTPPPAPTPPVSSNTTSVSSEPKTGTAVNTPPLVKESVAASVPDPQRIDPPVMAINDTTPTKIKEPVNSNLQGKTPIPWRNYLEIGGSFLAIVAMFIYIKKNYVHG